MKKITKDNDYWVGRFLGKIDASTDCWEWLGVKFHFGHGSFFFNGKNKQAHRVSYELYVDKIPEGECVLHRCDNPGCVNPEHLWTGSKRDNNLDCVSKGRNGMQKKDKCPSGHKYDKINISGGRVCGTCARDAGNRFYQKNKDKLRRKREAKKALEVSGE